MEQQAWLFRASPQASHMLLVVVPRSWTFPSHSMNRNPPVSSVQLAIQQPEQANKNTLEEMLSTAGDLAKTVTDLMAVIANVLQDVPYVNGIAGIVTQIIKIRDVTLILLYWAKLNVSYSRRWNFRKSAVVSLYRKSFGAHIGSFWHCYRSGNLWIDQLLSPLSEIWRNTCSMD